MDHGLWTINQPPQITSILIPKTLNFCQLLTIICQLSFSSKNPDFFLRFIGIKD